MTYCGSFSPGKPFFSRFTEAYYFRLYLISWFCLSLHTHMDKLYTIQNLNSLYPRNPQKICIQRIINEECTVNLFDFFRQYLRQSTPCFVFTVVAS